MPSRAATVFLNVPFDSEYEPLFVALITTLVAVGQRPTCVLEVPGQGATRRERLIERIRSCALSIHDLSRVQCSTIGAARIPRFNMPFELGVGLAISHLDSGRPRHGFVIFEEKPHRLQQTLTDINGIDPEIHHGTQRGIIGCVLNVYGGGVPGAVTTIRSMAVQLGKFVGERKVEYGVELMFHANIFRQTIAAATEIVDIERG